MLARGVSPWSPPGGPAAYHSPVRRPNLPQRVTSVTDFGLRTNGARRSTLLSAGTLESRICMTAAPTPAPDPAPTAAAPSLQDIINEARKNDEVKRLMDGGRLGLGIKPTIRASRPEEAGVIGGSRAVYVREGNRIVINLNAISNASVGAGSLLYELLRFKHRDEHKSLDDKAFKGRLIRTPSSSQVKNCPTNSLIGSDKTHPSAVFSLVTDWCCSACRTRLRMEREW